MPAFLSTFPDLRYVRLDNNQFEGGRVHLGWWVCLLAGQSRRTCMRCFLPACAEFFCSCMLR